MTLNKDEKEYIKLIVKESMSHMGKDLAVLKTQVLIIWCGLGAMGVVVVGRLVNAF